MDNFNNLTPGQDERLAMLAEEANEIGKASMKIMRHGYLNYHPKNPDVSNRELLSSEVTDLMGVLVMMVENGDLSLDFDVEGLKSNKAIQTAIARKLEYEHHQD